MVLHQVRRARREAKKEQRIAQFREYKPVYREILVAVETTGGDDAVDEVRNWLLEWTKRNQRLPEPELVREHARDVLVERGVDIPDQL